MPINRIVLLKQMNIIIYTEGEILSRESINLFNKAFFGDNFITSILKGCITNMRASRGNCANFRKNYLPPPSQSFFVRSSSALPVLKFHSSQRKTGLCGKNIFEYFIIEIHNSAVHRNRIYCAENCILFRCIARYAPGVRRFSLWKARMK